MYKYKSLVSNVKFGHLMIKADLAALEKKHFFSPLEFGYLTADF